MPAPAYETVALTLSNAPVLLPIASALWRWDRTAEGWLWRPLLMDATMFALPGLSSVMYHLCQSADVCFRQSLLQLRPADHVYVWTLGTWIGMRGLQVNPYVAVTITFWAQWVFAQSSSLLITTLVFPAIALAFFIAAFVANSSVFRVPLQHMCVFSVAWGGLMLAIGTGLYLIADDIEDPSFWWVHSIWHVLAFLGIWLIWEGITRYPYWHFLHTNRVYVLADRALQRFIAWEDGLFLWAPRTLK